MPDSFAQEDSPEYVVRFIYFIPNDREPDPNMDSKLYAEAKDVQKFYADQMEAHGFGRKTFRYETDENGNVKVHHVNGKFNEAYYQNPSTGSSIVWKEIEEQFDMSKNIYCLALDTSSRTLKSLGAPGRFVVGLGSGGNLSGRALITTFLDATIHELGHAFGLQHDSRLDANLIFTRLGHNERMTNSFCTAERLNVNRYFNPTQEAFNLDTNVKMLTPSLAAPPANIRLQFEVTDPDGLHQAQLLKVYDLFPSVIAYESLSGKRATVKFITSELVDSNKIQLQVIDKHGNFVSHWFDIDVTGLLPPAEAISIPDQVLAAAIREELGLASDHPITQIDMFSLRELINVGDERPQITDLTGLKHAINLNFINLYRNRVTDITPLLKLPKLLNLHLWDNPIRDLTTLKDLSNLRRLSLSGDSLADISFLPSLKKLEHLSLGNGPISDISPVWELTRLRNLQLINLKTEILDFSPIAKFTALEVLNLSRYRIKDITFLTRLTNLRDLFLTSNRIIDVSPLSQLVNLRQLSIGYNQISDIGPLAKLTNLHRLYLQNNNISNVSPLSELVNLRELRLEGNPVKNRKPLFDLLQKNPNVKIYIEWGGEPLPVNLSHFRAEHTEAGVILKWTTESEVDNAGFYIYRSKTKDGEFRVVNPSMIQGAGTTGERNEYTWTDTTAKPNTVYYYRIEDVSHAGVREQLATVRLRGLISARGKLTTIWADLKAEN